MGYRGNDPVEDVVETSEERIIEPEDMIMPVYEWKCPKCSNRFEKIKPIAEFDDDEYCPGCGSLAMPMATLPASIRVKEAIHTDSGLLQEYVSHAKTPEVFDRNLSRQGKRIEPEDM